jgi:hypothetical protein
MKKFIPYILSACLIISCSVIATEKLFSQTNQKENKVDSTNDTPAGPDGTSRYVTGLTTGRAKSLVGLVVGLISLILGWQRKPRSGGLGVRSGRSRSVIALVLGVIAVILSVIHLATTTGGFGTGGGKAGAILGLTLGLIGATRSGLHLSSKRKQNESYQSN